MTLILLAPMAYLLAVCIFACARQARANAARRRMVRAIEWHAAQARHPSSQPIYDQLARERMADDLADDGTIARWLA